MLPEFEPQINIGNTESTTETSTNGKSFLFSFEAGEFIIKDGQPQTATGIEGVKVWIQKILKTEKFKFKIYETGETNEYGVTLLDLIHGDYPQEFIYAEVQREITEALLKNTEISNVTNFGFKRDKRTLLINFDVFTIYGEITEEVSV